MPILLNNVNDNTVSAVAGLQGGSALLIIRGDDFSGGTVIFQIASKNDPAQRFLTLENGSFTAGGSKKIDYLPLGVNIRATLAGATTPLNVFVEVTQ